MDVYFTLNAVFQSFSFKHVCTTGFGYSRWGNIDNAGKMAFTHVIFFFFFVNAEVIKCF